MGRFPTTILASAILALAGAFAAGASASAATYCPTHQSVFGIVQSVSGNMLTITTDQGQQANVRVERDAHVNTNGTALRAGTYVGAYGCLSTDNVFNASVVTLSSGVGRHTETLSGVVQRVTPDRLLVREFGHGSGWWFVRDADTFRVGQQLTGLGVIGPNGAFYPESINGQSFAFEPQTSAASTNLGDVTLTGVVRSVRPGALIVWEPSHRTTGTWIVRDSDRFRVGQRLTARGSEDRKGNFYPKNITIQ